MDEPGMQFYLNHFNDTIQTVWHFSLWQLIHIVFLSGGLSKKRAQCLESCHWDTKQSQHTDDPTWNLQIILSQVYIKAMTAGI